MIGKHEAVARQARRRWPLAIGCAVVVVTGCGGEPAHRPAVLRTNIRADPAMIDPITYSELFAGDLLDNMYEGFTTIDEHGEVVPALAVRWRAHADNKGFRFWLRQGVLFHSGRAFTAADVKWSLEQLVLPGNRAGLNAKYAQRIEGAPAVAAGETTELTGVTIIDDHTIDIRFRQVEVLFPLYPLFMMDRRVVQEHGESWPGVVSAGTGPFKFVAWDRGQVVRMAAHDAYWGDGPHIEGLEFRVVPNYETAIAMYEAGELDLLYVEPEFARRVLRDEQFAAELLTVPSAQINYLGMNQDLYEPFRDTRVRHAICIALDRQGMVEGLYNGAAVPLYGQITEGVPGYNPDLHPIPYDPERARALLAEAGYLGGRGLPPLQVTGTEPNRNELAYIANQLKTVLGMPVEVQVAERGMHLAAMNAGQVAFFPWGWTANYPDGLYFLNDVWYGPSPYNRSRWQNDAFDALIERAQRTPDAEARYALYHEAEQVLLQDWGTCPTTVVMHIALVKPYVKGINLTPFRFLPFSTVTIE